MDYSVRLDRTFDVKRLQEDMQRAYETAEVHMNRTFRHGEGWKTIALFSVDGRTDADALRWAGWNADYRPTPVLKSCPYFEEIVDSFHCPIYRVRLSKILANTAINPHRDQGDTWAIGKIRLHIPIVTNPDVWFFVDDQRVIMNEGELWYADVSPLHSVQNRGTEDRVHMMLDVGVNDWLRAQFPEETLLERFRNFRERSLYFGRERLWELQEKTGLTDLKAKALKLLGR